MNGENKNRVPFAGLRMLISGILVFCGALLYMPQCSVVRTLPLVLILSAIADVVYKNMTYIVGCNVVFCFSMLCVGGMDIMMSALLSVIEGVLCLGCIYAVRLMRAGNKTKNNDLRKKCTIRSITVLAVCFAVYMAVCGNIISCIISLNANSKYVKQNYGDKVQIHHTAFDVTSREYKTYVSFEDDNEYYGITQECFVSKTTDNVRDYCQEKIMFDGNKMMRATLMNAVDMFEITNSGIDKEKYPVLEFDKKFDDYKNDSWYVVSLYHIVENKEQFEVLYDDCVSQLENASFKEIVICGGNANEVLYTARVYKDENGKIVAEDVKDFDEKYLEQFGVTEMTVLDYWYNK